MITTLKYWGPVLIDCRPNIALFMDGGNNVLIWVIANHLIGFNYDPLPISVATLCLVATVETISVFTQTIRCIGSQAFENLLG